MAAIVGGVAALGGLVATLKIGVDEFMQAQKVIAQTGAVLKSTGGVANVTSKRIDSLATSIMKMSGIDDEAIKTGENMLLTFTKIRNETGKGNQIFDKATLAMTDLAVTMSKGVTPSSAELFRSSVMLGKALNDPIKGVTALGKAGVQFDAGQKATIKTMVESGNILGAQKIILKELETQTGGSAKALGTTLVGQLNILKETFRNVAGDLVSIFIPYVSRAATALLGFVRQFAARPTFFGKVNFTIGLLTDAAKGSFKNLYEWWDKSKRDISPTSGIVNIQISGRAQFDKFFTNLETSANNLGIRIGKGMVTLLFGVFTSEGRGKIANMMSSFKDFMMSAGEKVFRITGGSLATSLINGIVTGIGQEIAILGSAFGDLLTRSVIDAAKALPKPIADAVLSMFKAAGLAMGRKGAVAFKAPYNIIIVDPIKEAIKTARASLAGLGSEIGGFLERVGAAGGKSKEAADIRKRLKDEADAREKARLTEAVAMATTDEDRATATRELNDYIANENADRLDAEAKAAQDQNQQDIQNLIQKFNDGTIAAEQFATDLNAIIGQDFGDSLGIAFVAGFKGAIANLITEIQGIQTGLVPGGQATAGSTVAGVQSDVAISASEADKAERDRKEANYQNRLQAWKDRRNNYRESLQEKYRKEGSDGGSKITAAERKLIEDAMVKWNENHDEPIRMAAGGILKRQVFTAGEAGREAVIPLGSSEAMNILRQAVGGGGGGATYNLVINAGLGTNPDELGRVIVESIKKFEKRNGQVFAGPQIQATSAGVSTNGGTQSRSLRMG